MSTMSVMNDHHLRYHATHQENAAHRFGTGAYGRFTEQVARSMGTPQFLIGQTTILIIWIVARQAVISRRCRRRSRCRLRCVLHLA